MYEIGLQLFTLRDELDLDFLGTLGQVAEIGYEIVEFAGNYGGFPAKDLRKVLEDMGLHTPATHSIGSGNIDKDLEIYEYNAELGVKYCVSPLGRYVTEDDYKRGVEFLNKQGELCKRFDLQLLYHNHASEFIEFDGRYGLDILLEDSDPELVKVELDTYWAFYAGVDPVEYLKKYKDRCPIIHIKDMSIIDGVKDYTEIGNGIMDILSILSTAKEIGSEYCIVEQDKCLRAPIESVKISFDNLNKLKKQI